MIEWKDSSPNTPPVGRFTNVRVRLRDGYFSGARPAESFDWSVNPSRPLSADIVAYEVVEPLPAFDSLEEAQMVDKKVDDSQRRKNQPLMRGAIDYFPDALLAVSELSRIANEKHNPGEPMHWSKGKSNDHADCCVRHLIDRGKWDDTMGEPVRHSTAAAWRALANLQTEIENEREKK